MAVSAKKKMGEKYLEASGKKKITETEGGGQKH